MGEIVSTLVTFIVALLIFGAVIALIARTMKTWGAGLQELRQDMWKMKGEIDEMKKQLADIVIRLS